MRKIAEKNVQEAPSIFRKMKAVKPDSDLHQLAFENSLQPNLITIVSNGRIIVANKAASKLFGCSKKVLLTKTRSTIFDVSNNSFKKWLKKRSVVGHSTAFLIAIKANGKPFHCKVASAVFMDTDGIKKAIIAITDMMGPMADQKDIDIKQRKIVADNILLAKSKQKDIDIRKKKIVADNILLAKLKQDKIDIQKDKIVANNIVLAKSKQKKIDIKKDKVVAENIVLAQVKSDARLAENNEWIKHIAKTSYDVMWDWDIVTGEIYAGDSVEEIFGYKVEKNTVSFNDFIQCLLPDEKSRVREHLWKTLASGKKSWNDSFMFQRYDGSIASVSSRASIVRDEKGKANRLIGAIKDVSKLEELEKKLEEQLLIKKEHKDIFQLAAKLSYDGIWDWNLLTGDFFLGDGFQDLFGGNDNNKPGKLSDWSKHLHPEDKEAVENGLQHAIASSATTWEHTYRFIKADGSVSEVFGKASIIRDADGKAYHMIGAIHDLSKQKELEEKLEDEIANKERMVNEFKENFRLVFNSSSDVLYDNDLVTNKVLISDSYEKEYGHKITSDMTPVDDWITHVHPDDKSALFQNFSRAIASTDVQWKYSYRFLKADKSEVNVTSAAIILRDIAGKAYRMIGSMQDNSKEKILEEKLELAIRLKEKQIDEITEDAKEAERCDIGKELHDNVNQLLGTSKLYLDMARQGGEKSEMFLNRSSELTLSAIEEIRKLTKGLTTDTIKNLGLCDAISNLAYDTMEVNPIKIFCNCKSFKEKSVSDKFKLNLFRMVQEQLNNILKHAKATEAFIHLSENKKLIKLTISDNGIGFDTSKKGNGIGLANIKSRAAAYNGTADFTSQPEHGCILSVLFPFTDSLSNMKRL